MTGIDYLAAAREAADDATKAHNPADKVTFARLAQAHAAIALAETLQRVADALGAVDLPSGAEDTDDEVYDLPGRVRGFLAVAEEPISPDCRTPGKHKACTGDAWDAERDVPTPCVCPCHFKNEAAA